MYIYIYIGVYVCVCVCVYTYIHINRARAASISPVPTRGRMLTGAAANRADVSSFPHSHGPFHEHHARLEPKL